MKSFDEILALPHDEEGKSADERRRQAVAAALELVRADVQTQGRHRLGVHHLEADLLGIGGVVDPSGIGPGVDPFGIGGVVDPYGAGVDGRSARTSARASTRASAAATAS